MTFAVNGQLNRLRLYFITYAIGFGQFDLHRLLDDGQGGLTLPSQRVGREGREQHRGFRPAVASRDPFFEKPYEASAAADATPAWEAAKSAPRSSVSANIKPKRKVAALFKAAQPETSVQ